MRSHMAAGSRRGDRSSGGKAGGSPVQNGKDTELCIHRKVYDSREGDGYLPVVRLKPGIDGKVAADCPGMEETMELSEFFRENPQAAVAFSGGVDSAYLLCAAKQAGADVTAYYVKSDFQPQFELEDAGRLAKGLHVKMKVLTVDVLANQRVVENPADRCYHCKKVIFTTIMKAAERDGYKLLLDGTNASDEEGDRPGMRALRELSVRSPLRECGLTKQEIRRLSKEAGLFTWNKPAYACLATRIPAGEKITQEKLAATEAAENYLFSLGFTDFRVRRFNGAARLQFPAGQLPVVLEKREEILAGLKRYYGAVLLDMEVRE